jgi:exosortase/archaeosortase family protein
MAQPRRQPTGSPRAAILGFLLRCVAYWSVALFAVSRLPVIEETGIRLTLGTLQLAYRAIGQDVVRSGNLLIAGGTSVSIVSDCSPHVPFLIFAAVVLAFPTSWRQRALGIVAGGLVIHVFNTIRIMALIGVLIWRPQWFEFAHVYLWQTGTVLVLFGTFALWMQTMKPRLRST